MTDIVERLRNLLEIGSDVAHEAADEIERLRAALEEQVLSPSPTAARAALDDEVHDRPAHNNPQLFGPDRDDTR